MKKSRIILLKCEKVIARYRNHHSLYYNELVNSYKEYINKDFIDTNTKELYLNHLNDLCNMIELENKSTISLFSLSVLLISIVFFAVISTITFFKSKDTLDANIAKANTDAKISVNYNNMDIFNPFIVSNDFNYKDLTPIDIDLSVTANKSKDEVVNYRIYLILSDENDFDEDKLSFSINSSSENNYIKTIKDCDRVEKKILLYSGNMKCNNSDKIELRMWLTDNQIDHNNKNFKFKLYVDGSVI